MSQGEFDGVDLTEAGEPAALPAVEHARPPQAGVLAGVGLVWLSVALTGGLPVFLIALIPGALLLTGGLAGLAMADEARARHLGALGGALGILLGLPLFLAAGFALGFLMVALAVVAFVAEGWISIQRTPVVPEVPEAPASIRLAAEVAGDDAVLGTMVQSLHRPSAEERPRIAEELRAAHALYAEHGWLANPADYHRAPPAPESVQRSEASFAGIDYDHVRFASEFEPRTEEPGRDRWLSRRANQTAHAWVMQHEGPPRPWLVCIHGYQMGAPWMDLPAFDARSLHRERGINLAFPVLPLHGPRKTGRVSGEHFMGAEFLDTVHAETQAMWDIRRLLHWIRQEGGETIGVYGLSLGGYNTSLLASLDDDLACAIAGIPATDFARLVWRHGPPRDLLDAQSAGVDRSVVDDVLRVVSPLALEPRVPKERRAIFGAIRDQLVPSDQVRDLWRHWDRPEIAWYPGAHLSFMLHGHVGRLVNRTLDVAGLQSSGS
jgi:hypothetical protein